MERRLADDSLSGYRGLGESGTPQCFPVFLLLERFAGIRAWLDRTGRGFCSLSRSLADNSLLFRSIELRENSLEQRAKCHGRLRRSWFSLLVGSRPVLRLLLFLKYVAFGVCMNARVLLNERHPFIVSSGLISSLSAHAFLLLCLIA